MQRERYIQADKQKKGGGGGRRKTRGGMHNELVS